MNNSPIPTIAPRDRREQTSTQTVVSPSESNEARRAVGSRSVPVFDDKVLQGAVVMVLVAIQEQDFLDGSCGFRPGRSVHKAIETLWKQMMDMGGGWM